MKSMDRNDPQSYYIFDDVNREVLMKRPDTPMPWINYLTNGTFHAFISQAAGGLAWYKTPLLWRINRYRFFHLPTDRSGYYVYINDEDTGQCWNPSFQPCKTTLDHWQAAHGMGYTRFEAEKDGVKVLLTYFVGTEENALVWNIKISNTTKKQKNLNLYAFVEFALMEIQRELTMGCYFKHQVSTYYLPDDDTLVYNYGVETPGNPPHQPSANTSTSAKLQAQYPPIVYMTADRVPDGYDGDRDEFIGNYRSESDPYAIEHGGCSNSAIKGGDACGALQFKLSLSPGETQTVNVFLGAEASQKEMQESLKKIKAPGFVDTSFEQLNKHWEGYLNKYQCHLPDEYAERMVNTWNPYQAHKNFLYSRNISFYATGTYRGVGYKDSAQDILSMIPFDLNAAKAMTRMMLSHQYTDGSVNHYMYDDAGWPPKTTKHSDDHLWIIKTIREIVTEEGRLDFLNEKVTYYDGGEGSVYEHMRKSVERTRNTRGRQGFPLLQLTDWNDQMFRVGREGKGESIWVSMQLGYMLKYAIEMAEVMGKQEDVAFYQNFYKEQRDLCNTKGWDGQWYRRAIFDSGEYLGTKDNYEAQVWVLPQAWSVMSGYSLNGRGKQAMDVVKDRLDSELGIKMIDPPVTTFPDPKQPMTSYNPGLGENASVFCHANCWAILAETMLGRGDRAWKYYRQLIPAVAMDKAGAWRYKAEPYVYSSNIFGPDSDRFGLANVSWVTGTAQGMYVYASQHILGIRTAWKGLVVDPCLPSAWKGKEVQVQRLFRGCQYHITIKLETGDCKGIKSMQVDGKSVEGDTIDHVDGRKEAKVTAVL
ncbi:MAG: GH36-type glycosyl hydrolase domain-containing protein [Planctomycetota bacterium]|jgi:cellobiose phosphorylase